MKRWFIYLLFMMVLSSCTKDETKDETKDNPIEIIEDKIYARLEDPKSRVQMNEQTQMVWTEYDEIYVFGPNTRKKYLFDGKTGDKEGSFTMVKTDTPANYELDKYYAISPSSGEYKIMTSGRFRLDFKSAETKTQTYVPNGIDPSTNLVIGTSNDGVNFKLINCLGYLRISLTGEKSVQSIELTTNSGETIAGQCVVYADDPKKAKWINGSNSASILLDCGEGVQLTDTPTHFLFAVCPTEFENGFTIKVTFTDGTIFPQSTTDKITITHNTITPTSVIETSDVSYQSVTIAYKGSRFVIPLISGAAPLDGYIDWGDGNTSLLNLVTSYEYTDNKEEHTITIKTQNAEKIKFSGIDGIEEIDLSKF